MFRTQFTVAGVGVFPLDMLRYDTCFPMRSDDVNIIENSMNPEIRQRQRTEGSQFEVILVAYHDKKGDKVITEGRWSSFGWNVVRGSVTVEKR